MNWKINPVVAYCYPHFGSNIFQAQNHDTCGSASCPHFPKQWHCSRASLISSYYIRTHPHDKTTWSVRILLRALGPITLSCSRECAMCRKVSSKRDGRNYLLVHTPVCENFSPLQHNRASLRNLYAAMTTHLQKWITLRLWQIGLFTLSDDST